MVLLNQALKRYKTLDVMGELGDDEDGANLTLPSSRFRTFLLKEYSIV